MILGGTLFTRTSYFVVGSVVLVSLTLGYLVPQCLTLHLSVYKLDYHGPEEGEAHDHHH